MNDNPPEGHDSAEGIAREVFFPEDILRIRRARAVAKRSIMGDLAAYCDAMEKQIRKDNPGRIRGSVSEIGEFAATVAKRIGDHIWDEREKIKVPE